MYHYERDYGVARFVFGFFELAGWVAVIAGMFLAVLGFNSGGMLGALTGGNSPMVVRLAATLPGFGTIIGGLFAVANAQSARANVDTAEMTRDMLAIMKRQSVAATPEPQVFAASREPSVAGPARSQGRVEPTIVGTDQVYRGITITETEDGFYIRGRRFDTIEGARDTVDKAMRTAERER